MKFIIGLLLATITFGATAQERIVSVGGSVTEIIYKLGKQNLLVGTDTTSNFPETATQTAKVGYMRALSAEGVLSLNPSVMFITKEAGPERVIKQLESAGVNIQTLPTEFNVEGVVAKVKAVSNYLNAEQQGQDLIKEIYADVKQAKQIINHAKNKQPKILFILSQQSGNLLVSGKNTQADGIIKLVGGVNPMTQFNSYKPLTPEQIAEVMPDIIIMMSRHGDNGKNKILAQLKEHPVLKLTPAVKNHKVITMNGSYLLGYGPRIGLALKDLAEQVYD
ncbi:hemin ABC transporter substrate-binding protein [Thiomicrorhabdus hydrogeniphila]